MLGLSGKEETVRINHLSVKCTMADANKMRKVEFFEKIYNKLLKKYSFDSRLLEGFSIEDILSDDDLKQITLFIYL